MAHANWKNTAGGVCIVIPYGNFHPTLFSFLQLGGLTDRLFLLPGDFNSKLKHYLLFNDLGVALKVLAGVAVIYPLSLLMHENCNRPSLVKASGLEEALAGRGVDCGNLVWFIQANFATFCEHGKSLGEWGKRPGSCSVFWSALATCHSTLGKVLFH